MGKTPLQKCSLQPLCFPQIGSTLGSPFPLPPLSAAACHGFGSSSGQHPPHPADSIGTAATVGDFACGGQTPKAAASRRTPKGAGRVQLDGSAGLDFRHPLRPDVAGGLVPVARFEMAKATIADRSVICGHEAPSDVQLLRTVSLGTPLFVPTVARSLGWSRMSTLLLLLALVQVVQQISNGVSTVSAIDAREAYAIDPLYCAYCEQTGVVGAYVQPSGTATAARLPYADPISGAVGLSSSTPPLAMVRVMVGMPTSLTAAGQLSYYDCLFTLQDDLAFGKPLSDQLRPQKTGLDGTFSWLATVWPTPVPEDIPVSGTNGVPGYRVDGAPQHNYQVSVAVFNRRDFSPPPTAAPADNQPPSERAVIADLERRRRYHALYAPGKPIHLPERSRKRMADALRAANRVVAPRHVLYPQLFPLVSRGLGLRPSIRTTVLGRRPVDFSGGGHRGGRDSNPACCFSVPAGARRPGAPRPCCSTGSSASTPLRSNKVARRNGPRAFRAFRK